MPVITDISNYYNEEELRLIQRAYRRLLRSTNIPVNKEEKALLRKALKLAIAAHADQRRKSGEPYVFHPLEVARITAAEVGLGVVAIASALLHDVVEDSDTTLKEIEDMFGDEIAKIVDGLTKLDGSYESTSPQAENFKKILSTIVDDVRVVLIKMADRLHNMRTIGSMPRDKQLKIAAETSYIFAPLAHRLGLYSIKTEFENLVMKVTEPKIYHAIEEKLNGTKKQRTYYIKKFIAPLKDTLDKTGIPYRITGRPKSIYSIWEKMETKKVGFEEVYDKFAIRIVIDVPIEQEKDACWQVYSAITNDYAPIPERIRDWVSVPKANGYESLHTTVIGPKGRYVEVQIRSERMDETAERGFAAHWRYKGVGGVSKNYDSWLNNIREILENSGTDAIEFLNDFKTNLFNKEIYVYTPKGEMKIMPKGATALDFAFNIHTEVGCKAQAIKVNNKLVPMGYKLQSGDQVNIITNKNQKPRENWLKFVITGKARSRIKSAMKEDRKKHAEFGKEALLRKFGKFNLNLEGNVDFLLKQLGYKSHLDMFYDIASDKINLTAVLKKYDIKNGKLQEKPDIHPKHGIKETKSQKSRKKKVIKETDILVNGEPADHFQYSLATCCNPVYGDDIFAFLTSSKGLKIHRSNCPNSTNLMAKYGYRLLNAEWVSNPNKSFVANLSVIGVDDGPGVIEKLSNKISSKLKLNMRALSISSEQGYFEAKISLFVSSTEQLDNAIDSLKQLEHVSSVTRIKGF